MLKDVHALPLRGIATFMYLADIQVHIKDQQ